MLLEKHKGQWRGGCRGPGFMAGGWNEDLSSGLQAAVTLSLSRGEAEPEKCFVGLCKGITAWFPKEAKLCQQALGVCLPVSGLQQVLNLSACFRHS